MKSKKSFFSRALIYNNLKRFWWIGTLYALLLLLISPLLLLTKTEYIDLERTLSLPSMIEQISPLLFTMPIFIAIMVFRYMQNPKAMVAMHSMPFTRLQLYINSIVSGLILSVGPLLVNAAGLFAVRGYTMLCTVLSATKIWEWLGITTLITLTLYAWTVLIGMFTGSSVAQCIFTYIFNFLVVGVLTGINILSSGVLFGFVGISDTTFDRASIFSPLIQVILIATKTKTFADIWLVDLIVPTIIFVIAYLIYKFRNLEDATEVISGKYIKPIFKYGVTVCTMMLGTIYIKEIFWDKLPNLWVYIGFALLGYVIAEMLLRKSFRILDSYKGFVGFIGAFAIIVACVKFDVIGFEKYIPNPNEIECVLVGSNQRALRQATEEKYSGGVLYEKENIEKVYNLHKEIIANKDKILADRENYKSTIGVGYKLKNGRKIFRSYEIVEKNNPSIQKINDELYASKEYKITNDDIYITEAIDISYMTITSRLDSDKTILVSNRESIDQILEAIKNDLLILDEDMKTEYRDIYEIGIKLKKTEEYKTILAGATRTSTNEYTTNYYFNINAKEVNKVLKENGYFNELYNSKDVVSLEVYEISYEDRLKETYANEAYYEEASKKMTYIRSITDRNTINLIIISLPTTNDIIDDEETAYKIVPRMADGRWGNEFIIKDLEKYL